MILLMMIIMFLLCFLNGFNVRKSLVVGILGGPILIPIFALIIVLLIIGRIINYDEPW